MEHIFERTINYYETDKMGIVHHSNYIRFLEEARCKFLKAIDLPYETLENNGIMIPVLEVHCKYKYHVSFGDTIVIKSKISTFTGVKMIVDYEIINKANSNLVMTAQTKHCFTNAEGIPLRLNKSMPGLDDRLKKEFNKFDNV